MPPKTTLQMPSGGVHAARWRPGTAVGFWAIAATTIRTAAMGEAGGERTPLQDVRGGNPR